MKRLLLLSILLFGFATISSAQSVDEVRDRLVGAIQKGQADPLQPLLNKTVDLALPGTEANKSAAQTVVLLKEFFMNYPVKDFTLLHSGQSENAYYVMGQYTSTKGTFDTNLFIRNVGGNFLVDQVRFEND